MGCPVAPPQYLTQQVPRQTRVPDGMRASIKPFAYYPTHRYRCFFPEGVDDPIF